MLKIHFSNVYEVILKIGESAGCNYAHTNFSCFSEFSLLSMKEGERKRKREKFSDADESLLL
jgi:hypothetical protein